MTRRRGSNISRAIDLALREFVNALGKASMYPPTHRYVSESSALLLDRLTAAMTDRDDLTFGITPRGFLLDGVALEPLPAMLRNFAARLHRKNIGTIRLVRGVTQEEVATLLGAIGANRAEDEIGAHGLRLDHLRVEPIVYDVLGFADPTVEQELDDLFWAQLVEAAFGRRLAESDGVPTASQVAEAITERAAAGAESARRVFEALAAFSSALAARGERASGSARRRFVDVLAGLSRATTTRVVSAAPSPGSRRRFLRETLELVPPVLLLQLLESVAEADGEPISPQLRWLLGKLAGKDGTGDEPAHGAFAGEVMGIVETWEGVGIEEDEEEDPRLGLEPARVLAMGLELDDPHDLVCQAARDLAERGHLLRVLEMLDHAENAPAVVQVIADAVLEPELLTGLLRATPLDYPLIARVAQQSGAAAVGPLLDALEAADDRTTRRRLLDILIQVGAPAEQELLLRLEGAPWFLARNILTALAQFPRLDDPAPVQAAFAEGDVRVRHEALKVLLRHPSLRDRTASEALLGGEEALVRTTLAALGSDCPPGLVAPVLSVLAHPNEEIRLQAIRLLADSNNPLVVPQLLRLVRTTRGIFRRTRLLPRSRSMLAALEVLSRRWSNHRPVLTVLQLAAKSSDPDVRAALRGGA